MRMSHLRAVTAVGALALTLVLGACGSTSTSGTPPPWHVISVRAPAVISGYNVQLEPKAINALNTKASNALLTGGTVFSFRQGQGGDLLAVLEIGEFKPGTDVSSKDFQEEVVGQIGQSVPRPTHELGRVVYEGSAPNQQAIFMWFDGNRMKLLLVHGIDKPRNFLQAVLRSGL